MADLSPAQKDELVVSLSALLLHDSKADISADNLNAIIKVRRMGGTGHIRNPSFVTIPSCFSRDLGPKAKATDASKPYLSVVSFMQ